jgi:hypothetical protein
MPTAYASTVSPTEQCEKEHSRSDIQRVADTPQFEAKLFVDALGQRVVVALRDSAIVLLVHEGNLISSKHLESDVSSKLRRVDGSLDWSAVPHALSLLASEHFGGTWEERLFEEIHKTDANFQDHLTEAIGQGFASFGGRRGRLLRHLDEPHQVRALDHLLSMVRSGDEAALDDVKSLKEVKNAQIDSALVMALKKGNASSVAFIRELARRRPPGVAEATCEVLERAFFNWKEPDDEVERLVSAALALTAEGRFRCPWATMLLELKQCDGALDCTVPPEDEDESLGRDETLCSPEEQERALQEILGHSPTAKGEEAATSEDSHEEDLEETPRWPALLLKAAEAQGPLSTSVSLALSRRSAKIQWPNDEPFDCEIGIDDVGLWACQLPKEVVQSKRNACHIEIDDRQHIIRVTPIPPEDRLE